MFLCIFVIEREIERKERGEGERERGGEIEGERLNSRAEVIRE